MNFIAGLLLCYMVEEEAYWVLQKLMHAHPFELYRIFSDGTPLVHCAWFQMEKLMDRFEASPRKALSRNYDYAFNVFHRMVCHAVYSQLSL